jgi:ribosomal protein S18 acetylase RimI-like enzyme
MITTAPVPAAPAAPAASGWAAAIAIRRLDALDQASLDNLADILVATVNDGASVGFLPPMAREEAVAFWRAVSGPNVRLYVAELDGRIAGTVQLQLSPKPNASHRAELCKLLVHPSARRRGLGRALMEHAEREARALGRTLLVLDTRAGDPSNDLYRSMGWIEYGRVPRYARSGDGTLDECVFYYKELG